MDAFAALLHDFLFNYTVRTVALGTAILGGLAGVLGSFVILRRQSLMGDSISHATLPGLVLTFLLLGERLTLPLLIGASITAWVGALLVLAITTTTRIKEDSAMGLILSVFFGGGLMLLAYIQKHARSNAGALDEYLFGQAATLIERDVIAMGAVSSVALVLVLLFWKEFKLLTFDPAFAQSQGFPVRLLDVLLTTLVVVAVAVGLQAVGVVLMVAVLVAPAAAARQWSDSLGIMVALAALFGAFSAVSGTLISSTTRGMATGPVIVLINIAIAFISLALAPNRGVLWRWLRQQHRPEHHNGTLPVSHAQPHGRNPTTHQ